MNSSAADTIQKLKERFGDSLQVASPQGERFAVDGDRAVFVLSGAVDLFFAERLNGDIGFSLPLLPRVEAGALIAPMPASERIACYGRCLPNAEIVFLRWSDVLAKDAEQDLFLHEAVCAFAALIRKDAAVNSMEELARLTAELCDASEAKIEAVKVRSRELIRNNRTEQERQKKSFASTFAALLENGKKVPSAFDPFDPLAAAARNTAQQVGIKNFILERGKTPEQRLARSAQKRHIRITPARLKGDWYKENFYPVLAVSANGENAYCVFRNKHNDPVARCGATGTLYAVNREFCRTLAPLGWNFVVPFPEAPLTGTKLFLFALRPFKKKLPLLLVLFFLSSILDMFIPVINSKIFSEVIPNSDRLLLGQLTFLLFTTAFAQLLLTTMNRMILWSANEQTEFTMQMALFDHLMRLPVDFFRKYSPGEMAARSFGIRELFLQISTSSLMLCLQMVFFIFPVGMLFYYSAKMATAVLILLLLLSVLIVGCAVMFSKIQRQIFTRKGEISGLLERFLANIEKLKSAGAENQALLLWIQKFSGYQSLIVHSHHFMNIIQVTLGVLSWAIFAVGMAVILWTYNHGKVSELIPVSDFSGFISAVALVTTPLLAALNQISSLLQIKPVFQWLSPLLTAPEEKQTFHDTEEDAEDSSIQGKIELDNVSFAYDSEHPVLNNVSLKADPGEFIAITGESGAGKSTLLRLMLHFETPTSGTVLIDGEDISLKNMTAIRSQIGVVLQNASLMPQSIRENITGLTNKYTEEDAWRAAEMAGCAEDIRSFPMQMQTLMTGSTVSGGQQQRILLAHALIRNPKLIFLDEATSALDNRTQRIVIDSLRKVKATKVVIAHRLSTIMDANRIYVLEHGSVVETGTYQELMKKQGVFARMAARQLVDGLGE